MTLADLERFASVAEKHGWTVTEGENPGAVSALTGERRRWRWICCARGGIELRSAAYVDGNPGMPHDTTLTQPSGSWVYVPTRAVQETLEAKP